MKTEYKVKKEISLLTIAQAGPKGCWEFRGEWIELLEWSKENRYNADCTISEYKTNRPFCTGFFEWAESKPKRIQWLIDKGFVERVEPELKPCPFCGLGADIHKDDRLAYYVQCPCCHAMIDNYSETPSEAIKAWNRRV